MSQVGSDEIYYPVSWIKTTTDLILNLFSSPQKTKRSLPEEAECGSVEGIKCWLREGKKKTQPIINLPRKTMFLSQVLI